MANHDTSRFCKLWVSSCIPAEVILETIQHLPFGDGKLISSLRCAHPRLHDIFRIYERSITVGFMRKELRHAQIDFQCQATVSLDWLANCVEQYNVVDDVMDVLFAKTNCFGVERHNICLANTGLLLLYRVVSIEGQGPRIAYLQSLQRDPLIAIYIVIQHATLSARYHGSGWIHQRTYGRFMDANQISLRNELEFCFAEAALSYGPKFVSDMLLHHDSSCAEATLLNVYHDFGSHDWLWPCWGNGKGEFEPPRTQGPQRSPEYSKASLFSTLLEAMSEAMRCPLNEVRSRVEQRTHLKHHPLAYLGLEGKAVLLQGLNLEEKP
ncbi:hypothetical protein ACN47E_001309 [Coniothyrium glycines]